MSSNHLSQVDRLDENKRIKLQPLQPFSVSLGFDEYTHCMDWITIREMGSVNLKTSNILPYICCTISFRFFLYFFVYVVVCE